jgi:type I restriction enzyme S subunit
MSEWKETDYGSISHDWNFIPASRFCSNVTDGTHDSPKPQENGKHLITSKHIKNRIVDFENAYLISEEDFNKINIRSKVDQWDVIISMIGEYCGFCFIERSEHVNYAVKNVGLFKAGNELKAFWLYYYLNSKIGRYILETNKSGTSQPYLTLGFLRDLPILYPPSDKEANEIVFILRCLDDKIDLLHRQNKTLEAMAETLFRQWFMEKTDEQVEEVPISSVVDLNPTRTLTIGSIAPYLEMANVSTTAFHPDNWYCREFSSGMKFVNGDTLLARITPCLENGKSTYVTFLGENQIGWGSTEFIVLRPKDGFHPLLAYALIRNRDFRDYAEGCLEGSSGRQRVNIDHLKDYSIFMPKVNRIKSFNKSMMSFEPKLDYNFRQIRTLQNLCDSLLPKLMNGEVRLKEALNVK